MFEPEHELTFRTDDEAVCAGLDRAALELKKGERALITIPAEYAVGCAPRHTPSRTNLPHKQAPHQLAALPA